MARPRVPGRAVETVDALSAARPARGGLTARVPCSPSMEPGPDIPDSWRDALDRVARARRVLVVGPADAGKSTFSLLAARRGALLDADPGQGSLGPPACLTIAVGSRRRSCFVGTTDPVRGHAALVAAAVSLSRVTRTAPLVVNTDGLVAGPGRRLKAELAAALRPSLVVGIGEEAGPLLRDLRDVPSLRLDPSSRARRKTGGARRAARRAAFAASFAEATPVTLPVDPAWPAGLLLGVLDGRGRTLGLGLVAPEGGVLTSVEPRRARQVVPGSLLLDGTFGDRPWRPPL